MSAPELEVELADGKRVAIRDGLAIRPGDTLLLRFDERLTMAEFEEFRDRLRAQLSDSVRVCLVDRAADWAVFRPGDDAAGG